MKTTFLSGQKGVKYVGKGAFFTDLSQKMSSIRQSNLFKAFPEKKLLPIAQKANFRVLPGHTIFIYQDDMTSTVFFIVKGMARIYRLTLDGSEVNIGLCGPGDILGEMAVIRKAPRSATVESIQEMHVLELSAKDFNEILQKYPQIAVSLLETFSQRLQNNNIYMEEVLGKNLKDRTLDILHSLGKYFPQNDVVLSQEELAIIVGATRARVSEVLNTLATEGKISLSHRKIHLN